MIITRSLRSISELDAPREDNGAKVRLWRDPVRILLSGDILATRKDTHRSHWIPVVLAPLWRASGTPRAAFPWAAVSFGYLAGITGCKQRIHTASLCFGSPHIVRIRNYHRKVARAPFSVKIVGESINYDSNIVRREAYRGNVPLQHFVHRGLHLRPAPHPQRSDQVSELRIPRQKWTTGLTREFLVALSTRVAWLISHFIDKSIKLHLPPRGQAPRLCGLPSQRSSAP